MTMNISKLSLIRLLSNFGNGERGTANGEKQSGKRDKKRLNFYWGNGSTVLILLGILGCGAVTGANAQPTPEPQKNPYPQEVSEAYLEACLQGSMAQGLTEQQSKTLCACTLEQFQTRYTFEEFVQVSEQTNENGEPPAEIFEIGATCAASLTR